MNINRWFSPDNMFFSFMSRISDLMILNFLWMFFSIPIITIGASTTALYDVSLKIIEDREGYILKSFLKSFKENFKRATIVWIIIIFISFVIGVNLTFWIKCKAISGYIPMSIILFIFFTFLITETYIFPVLSKFNKTVKETIKYAFILSMRYLPYSLAIVFIYSLFLVANLIFPLVILFMIFIGFAFCAFINSYLFRIVFKKCVPYLEGCN